MTKVLLQDIAISIQGSYRSAVGTRPRKSVYVFFALSALSHDHRLTFDLSSRAVRRPRTDYHAGMAAELPEKLLEELPEDRYSDESGSDWEEVEEEEEEGGTPCRCLFCSDEFTGGALAALEHCFHVHGLQLQELVTRLGRHCLKPWSQQSAVHAVMQASFIVAS